MGEIPFNRPYLTGKELGHIEEAYRNLMLSGNGPLTRRCEAWLERETGTARALLAHSCTAALEIAAMLVDVGPGDEVIMPSYTFVSTANAFVLRGAKPVFVDIRPDTLNIDEALVPGAITDRTRAIAVVHYAGVGCEMDAIGAVARTYGLQVVEDAAQGVCATYGRRPLGSFGDLAAMSFHETKNITCGEGGALLVNRASLIDRAEIIREKGTNRRAFARGSVDKYSWVDIGSSYLPGEISAGFLLAQMEEAWAITRRRLAYWQAYHDAFAADERAGRCRRPVVPAHCGHNAHMYYLLLPSTEGRARFIAALAEQGICSIFHYVPLHSSPAGLKWSRTHGSMTVTDHVAGTLVRLPMFIGVDAVQDRVIDAVRRVLAS